MRNSMKVAKWEIRRNLKNKTFLIGLFLTPLLFLFFGFLGSLFNDSDDFEEASSQVFINDQLGLYSTMEEMASQNLLDWEMEQTDANETEAQAAIEENPEAAYIFLDERALDEGLVPLYIGDEASPFFINQAQMLAPALQAVQIERLDLSEAEAAAILQGVNFEEMQADAAMEPENDREVEEAETAFLERLIPGIFAGVVMLSIVFTGMAIFQSASQEKKDKIAEIILSSLTPSELMQGKIFGYFVLGLIQVVVFVTLIFPFVLWLVDIPILEYLLVPQTLFFLFIAVLSYLMFASIFVGIGATMSDISTAGNFQGMVMMLPFLPFIIMGPVLGDPSGLIAQIGSYVPFTAPGVLLMRLTMLEEWPWIEIAVSLGILLFSVVLFMKLAGKIFKVGILMYGKNATPGEIWKWIRTP